MFPAPAAKVVVPATDIFPASSINPLAMMLKLPDMVEAPRLTPLVSVKVTLLPLVMVTNGGSVGYA